MISKKYDSEKWLSIIVAAYNVERWISQTLESLAAQDLAGVEILIGDDASTDATMKVAANVIDRLALSAQVHRFHINRGQAVVRNALLAQASGKYIWFFDSDDKMKPNAIHKIRELADRKDPDWIGVNFEMLRAQMSWKHRLRGEFNMSSFAGPSGELNFNRIALLKGSLAAGQMHPWSRVIKRSILDRIKGPFTPGMFFEDVNLIPRLALQVNSFYHINEPLVQYRQHATSTLRTMTDKKILDMACCLIDVRTTIESLTSEERTSVAFEYDHYAAKMYIGAMRQAAKSENRTDLSSKIKELIPKTFLSDPRNLVYQYTKRGWGLRSIRLIYWLNQ
jgi:Glycosyl transferase family 2